MAKAQTMVVSSPAGRRASLPTIPRELVDAIETAIEIEHAAEDRRKRGGRSSAMFYLAHSLHGALADLSETEALEIVGWALQMRHPGARDPWAAEFPSCPVDLPVAFVENLRLIQLPPGMLDRAIALAKAQPVPIDEISPRFALFKALCQVLQDQRGSQPFILSVERFGQALGVRRETITIYKRRARREGWLQLVSAAIPKKRAARYRFESPTTSHEGSGGFLKDLEGRNTGRGAAEMLSAFATVGAGAFDVTLTDLRGEKVAEEYRRNRSLEELLRTISRTLREAERDRHNVIIRPRSTTNTLIQLDDLEDEMVHRIAPYAFLVIRTSPGNHQAWIAVTDGTPDFSRRLRKGVEADLNATGATRISGSLNFKTEYAPSFPRVEIVHMNAGYVTTTAALDEAGFVAAPDQPRPLQLVDNAGRPSRKVWPSYELCVQGAPLIHRGHRPDISRADFTWCRIAIQWGWSVQETAERLMKVSAKARENGKRYALRTATRAAESDTRQKRFKHVNE